MSSKLYMIRHGEAVGNIDASILKDDRKNFLSKFGALQAQLTGQWFEKHKIDLTAIVSSDLCRARHTASAIRNQLTREVPWYIDPAFNEFADWEERFKVEIGFKTLVLDLLTSGDVLLISHYYTMRAIFDHLVEPDCVASCDGKKINYCQIFVWDTSDPARIISLDVMR